MLCDGTRALQALVPHTHLDENNNKTWENEKLLLSTGFEFVYAITALYSSTHSFNEENPCAQNHGK